MVEDEGEFVGWFEVVGVWYGIDDCWFRVVDEVLVGG